MTVDVLDLTHSDVSPLIGHLTVGATTSPSTTEVTAWITRLAARAWGALRSRGYTPTNCNSSSTGAAEEAYQVARDYVTLRAAARWLRANANGDDELALRYEEEATEWYESLRRFPRYTTGDSVAVRVQSTMTDTSHVRTTRWSRGSSYR